MGPGRQIPYKDPSTGEDRILTIANDMTEQVNAAADLRRSEERFNLAVEMSSIGTWDWNIRTGELYWSPRMREIIGSTEESFMSAFSDFEGRLHADDVERVRAARNAHLQDRVPYSIEYRLRHNDGRDVWVRARGQAVWDDEGNPVRMAGSTEDVTERVELEHRLACLAHHDSLTGLFNRAFFNEDVEAALNRERCRHGRAVADCPGAGLHRDASLSFGPPAPGAGDSPAVRRAGRAGGYGRASGLIRIPL